MPYLFDRLFFSKYLEPKEKIVHVIHKHLCPILWSLLKKSFLYCIIPVAAALLFRHLLVSKIAGIFLILGLLRIGYQMFRWYSSVFLLTDKHLIYIDWHSIIKQNVVRIHYEDIETIEVHISTLVQNIFNFGHLEIKTSNNTNNKTLYYASEINRSQSKIADLQDRKLQDRNQNETKSLKRAITESLHELALSKH